MSQSFNKDRLEETIVLGSLDVSDRLLSQLTSFAPDVELEDALWGLVSTFAEGQDELSVGVCVPQVGGEQLIVRHAPRPSQPRVTDAAHLFPETDHELVLSIPHDDGASLHIANGEPIDAALRRAAEQLAAAVGSVIRQNRYVERLRREVVEVSSLRERAVQSDKLAGLGRMAASIVHELNNPLTSIVAYADFLRKRLENQSAVEPADRERLSRISEAAGRVLNFTRDLVAYSRPSTADPSALSLHDVIERALVFCEHTIEHNQVTVVKDYGELPPIKGLHGPLTQVFVNLITNACQAMAPNGGKLVIATHFDELARVVRVHVSDEGHGIQHTDIDRLFEPYFTTRGDGGGSGLGLNIVQTIVASHGGNVSAENRLKDAASTPETATAPKGAVFTVELPSRS